jgi:hypothetical protein
MNSDNITRTERANVSVGRLRALLDARGFSLAITPVWYGRVRHGLMHVLNHNDNPTAIPAEAMFKRSSQLWCDSDAQLGIVRTGSPKHIAVLDLLTKLGA